LPPEAVWVSVAVSFDPSSSSSADTVTVRTLFQFVVVKVSEAGLGVRSVSAWPAMVTVTSAVGSEASLTV